jgi:histidine ammonia-lyase
LTASRGIQLRGHLEPAPATAAVLAELRRDIAGPGPDRFLAPDIEAAVALVRSGRIRAAAETLTGTLR